MRRTGVSLLVNAALTITIRGRPRPPSDGNRTRRPIEGQPATLVLKDFAKKASGETWRARCWTARLCRVQGKFFPLSFI